MIPSQSHPINGGGRIDPVWLRWLAQLERGALAGKESGETNAEAIAAIATALGSPDGTVANIPDQSSGTSATITGQGPIEVTGSLASGSVTINGRSLTDSGEGTFKLLTRDSYGRVSGTADGAAADVPYDNTASGLAATEVQAAVDELAAEKLDDAPSDGSTYGRKNGAWAVATGSGGGMTLVGSAVVAGAAATSLTVSGLDLAADGSYLVEIELLNALGSAVNVGLYYNSDTTDANYSTQVSYVSGGTNAAVRVAGPHFSTFVASQSLTGAARIQLDCDGRPRANIGPISGGAVSAIEYRIGSHGWVSTANVTSLTIMAASANALAVGSRVRVYRN